MGKNAEGEGVMEFTTVEGFPIKVGECYQTRDGRKVFIGKMYENDIYPLKGWVTDCHNVFGWKGTGFYSGFRRGHDFDLMRPWPVSKMEITDEIVWKACNAYNAYKTNNKIYASATVLEAMKAALQAVFDHIAGGDKMVECNKDNRLDSTPLEKQCAKNAQSKKDIFDSFPPENPIMDEDLITEDSSVKQESDDGWIEWDCKSDSYPDLPFDTIVAVKFRNTSSECGKIFKAVANWNWGVVPFYPSCEIIAYRIVSDHIPEAKEKVKSKKETFIEFISKWQEENNSHFERDSTWEIFQVISDYLETI